MISHIISYLIISYNLKHRHVKISYYIADLLEKMKSPIIMFKFDKPRSSQNFFGTLESTKIEKIENKFLMNTFSKHIKLVC